MYGNYYQPPYQAYNPLSAQRQELIRVNGLEGAKAYQMPANSVVALFDSNQDLLYVKSTDGAGFPSIRTFAFTEQIQNGTATPTEENAITLTEPGYYQITVNDTVQPGAATPLSLTVLENGIPLAGAISTATPAAADDDIPMQIMGAVSRVFCHCCKTLSFILSAADWYKTMASVHLDFNNAGHAAVKKVIDDYRASGQHSDLEPGMMAVYEATHSDLMRETAEVRYLIEQYSK